MKRLMWLSAVLIVVGGAALSGIGEKPSIARAGGLPCFLCHGVNFEGSDLAPRVNGTKLTDAEILHQVHNPRGVMPAFGPNDFPDDATIIRYIRSLPSAGPTKTLTKQERAQALATIAAVAQTRSAAAAAGAYGTATPTSIATPAPKMTPTSAPAGGVIAVTPESVSQPPAQPTAPVSIGTDPTVIASAAAMLLIAALALAWVATRRRRATP